VLSATVNGALVAPATVTALMTSGSMPVLVTVSVVVERLFTGCRANATLASAAIVGGVAAVPDTFATTVRPVEVTTVSVAVLTPDTVPVGLNRKANVHDAPAASDLPVTQVTVGFVITNWLAFAPPRLTGLVVIATVPVLRTVIVWIAELVPTFWVPKVTGDGVMVTTGSTPFPLRLYVFGVAEPFEVMVSVAVFAPVVVGANLTLMTQVVPGATGAAQLVALKEPESVPDKATLDTVKSASPVLLTVIVFAADVEPIAASPKVVSVAGAKAATGASRSKVRATAQVPLTAPGVEQKLSCSKLRSMSTPSGRTARLSVTRTKPNVPPASLRPAGVAGLTTME
jgi:hypothetical protein